MLRHVVLQGRLTGVPPGTEGLLALVGLGIAGLLSQVVKLEGDFVVGVEEASVTEVPMLRDQNLRRRAKADVSVTVHSGFIVAIWDKNKQSIDSPGKHMPDHHIRRFWQG